MAALSGGGSQSSGAQRGTAPTIAELQRAIVERDAKIADLSACCAGLKTSETTLTSYAKQLAAQLERLEDEKTAAVYLARTSSSRAVGALASATQSARGNQDLWGVINSESQSRSDIIVAYFSELLRVASRNGQLLASHHVEGRGGPAEAKALQAQVRLCLDVIKQLEAEIQYLRKSRGGDPNNGGDNRTSASLDTSVTGGLERRQSFPFTSAGTAAVGSHQATSELQSMRQRVAELELELDMLRRNGTASTRGIQSAPTSESDSKIATLTRALADRDEALLKQQMASTASIAFATGLSQKVAAFFSGVAAAAESRLRDIADAALAAAGDVLRVSDAKYQQQMSVTRSQVVDANARVARLCRTLTPHRVDVSLSQATARLSDSMQESIARAASLEARFDEAARKAVERLASVRQHAESEMDAGSELQRRLRHEVDLALETSNDRIAAMAAERLTVRDECDRLIAEAAAVEETFSAEMDAKAAQIVELHAALDEARSEAERGRAQLAADTDLWRSTFTQLEEARRKLAAAEVSIERTNAACQTMASSFDDAESLAELDDLQERVAALVAAVASSSSVAARCEAESAELRADLIAARTAIETLQHDKDALVGQLDAAARAAADHVVDAAGARRLEAQAADEVARLSVVVAELREQLQAAVQQSPDFVQPTVDSSATQTIEASVTLPSIAVSLESREAQTAPSAVGREVGTQADVMPSDPSTADTSDTALSEACVSLVEAATTKEPSPDDAMMPSPQPSTSSESTALQLLASDLTRALALLPGGGPTSTNARLVSEVSRLIEMTTAALQAAPTARQQEDKEEDVTPPTSATVTPVTQSDGVETDSRATQTDEVGVVVGSASQQVVDVAARAKHEPVEALPASPAFQPPQDDAALTRLKAELRRLQGDLAVVQAERDSLMLMLDEAATAAADIPVQRDVRCEEEEPSASLVCDDAGTAAPPDQEQRPDRSHDTASLSPAQQPATADPALSQFSDTTMMTTVAAGCQTEPRPHAADERSTTTDIATQFDAPLPASQQASPQHAQTPSSEVAAVRAQLASALADLDLSQKLTDAVSEELSVAKTAAADFELGLVQAQRMAWRTLDQVGMIVMDQGTERADAVLQTLYAWLFELQSAAQVHAAMAAAAAIAPSRPRDPTSEVFSGSPSRSVGRHDPAAVGVDISLPRARRTAPTGGLLHFSEQQSPDRAGATQSESPSRLQQWSPDEAMFHDITSALGEQASRAAEFLYEGRQLHIVNTETLQRLVALHEEDHARDALRHERTLDAARIETHSTSRRVTAAAAELLREAAVGLESLIAEAEDRLNLLHICQAADASRIRNEALLASARLEAVHAMRQHAVASASPSPSTAATRSAAAPTTDFNPTTTRNQSAHLVTLRPRPYSSPLRTSAVHAPSPTSASRTLGNPIARKPIPSSPRRSSSPASVSSAMAFMPSAVHGQAATSEAAGSISSVLHDMAYHRSPSASRRDPPSLNMARAIVIVQQLERQESASAAVATPPRTAADFY